MIALNGTRTGNDRLALLNCRRLPGRLNINEAAILLGFKDHDIAALMAAKLLIPLGRPAPNAPKYFAAVDVAARMENASWLSDATRVITRRWAAKNSRKMRTVNKSP